MKTLTIKELAPYLPYGLEIWVEGYKKTYLMSYILHWSQRTTHRNIGEVLHEDNNCKPILRPLSDLTKEIEHNGEKFVPIKELSAYSRGQTEEGTNGLEWGIIETFPYSDLVKLFKWHFDVFGLIDAGLAIDINTLSK